MMGFLYFSLTQLMSASENMSMVYFVDSFVLNQALISFEKGVLPKPMGVKLNGLIERTDKFFGFTNYNRTTISSLVTGFTNYTDGFTKEGEILNYNKVITL